MAVENRQDNEMSYELYKEIADELCVPVDERLPFDVRFELYSSKLVYLNHLRGHCFRSVNQLGEASPFGTEDLAHIQKAIDLTKGFLSSTVREAFVASLSRAGHGAA
jgi:hypothetical protein